MEPAPEPDAPNRPVAEPNARGRLLDRLALLMALTVGAAMLLIFALMMVVFGVWVIEDWRFQRDKGAYQKLLDELIVQRAPYAEVAAALAAREMPYLTLCGPAPSRENCPQLPPPGTTYEGRSEHEYNIFISYCRARVMITFDDAGSLVQATVHDSCTSL